MFYVEVTESGDGAIVDFCLKDYQLLTTLCREVGQAVEHDQIFARTGYTKHAYDYLLLWMVDNLPNAAPLDVTQLKARAFLKDRLGSPTTSELRLATRIGNRWQFNRDALLMFDMAIREVLNSHGEDDPPFWELPIITGYDEGDFLTLQQEIKGILEAIELAAQQADDPSVVSDTTPSPARSDEECVLHNDELVAVEYPDSAPTAVPSEYFESLILANLTPREVEPSPARIVPPQRRQTVEDGDSQRRLPPMRRQPDDDRAEGADPIPSSQGETKPTNPHFAQLPPHMHSRRITFVDWVHLLRPKRWRRRKGGR